MLKFETRGTPAERGAQQAGHCKELALPWFKNRLDEFCKGVGVQNVKEAMAKVGPRLRELTEEFHRENATAYEEFHAIGEGLGLGVDAYFLVILSEQLKWSLQCTTIGFHDESGVPFIGKTDDIFKDELGMNVLETTFPDKGHRYVHFHFAATGWTVAGMNECGLAIGMNGIPGPVLNGPGQFSLNGLTTILPKCATVAEAAEYLRALKLNCSGFSLMMADSKGDLALVEKNPLGTALIDKNENGFLFHTNEILDRQLAGKTSEQIEPMRTNSRERFVNGNQVLSSLPRTEQGVNEFLMNRADKGPIRQKGEGGLYSDFGVYMAPTEKRIVYYPGLYRELAPETIELDSLFLNPL
jgi:Acyl-coenzyme A:6-aminopenicillanic acid acyl-transferase